MAHKATYGTYSSCSVRGASALFTVVEIRYVFKDRNKIVSSNRHTRLIMTHA